MSDKHISIRLDRKSAKEGEFVTVIWSCNNPEGVTLTIDSGYSIRTVQLADSGSRSFQAEKSKKKTVFRLNAVMGGKIYRKEAVLKVDNFKPAKATGARTGRVASLQDRWQDFRSRLEYGWSALPQPRQKFFIIAFAILIAMWLVTIGQRSGFKAGYEKGLQESLKTENVVRG